MMIELDKWDEDKPVEVCSIFRGPHNGKQVRCDVRRDYIRLFPPTELQVTRALPDGPTIEDSIEMLVYRKIEYYDSHTIRVGYVLESEYEDFKQKNFRRKR